MMNGARLSLCAGIFLISLAALSFEVALTRLFSVAVSYHFAFMVVSLAVLGYGAGGSFLALFPTGLEVKGRGFLSLSALGFSVACVGTYAAANHIPFDPFRVAWDRLQFAYLLADYLLLSVPFFFSGLCLSGALTLQATDAGQIYFSDLAGAGVGSLLVLFLVMPFGGHGMVIVPALATALGALILGLRRPSCRLTIVLSSLVLGVLALLLWMRPAVLDVQISPYKSLSAALRYPGSKILETHWNAFSRVDVVDSPLVRFAPGLSLNFLKPIPPQLGITIDGDNMTAMTRYKGEESVDTFLSHLPDAAPYRIARADRVLVLNPGGGLAVIMALACRSREIDVVFDNPLVFELVAQNYGAFSGNIFRDSRVRAVIQSSRSFLRKANRPYDVIHYSPLTSLGASSTGIRGLQENYMFTVEAIQDILDQLRPGGILSITQYLLPPPRQEIRLVNMVLEALDRVGAPHPELHLAMFRSWGTFTLLLKQTPFSQEEIRRLVDFCEGERFDTVYFPGMSEDQANRYNRFRRPIYFEMVQDLLSPAGRERLVKEYLFDLKPVTDDNPYFFNFFRLDKIIPLYRALHNKWQPFVEGGYLVPVVLIESIIAALFLILLPGLFRRWNYLSRAGTFRFSVLAYFALLGWGYMFVEIVLIQKLVLFLDHPVYAMATVLFGLLTSSGLGSFFSQRFGPRRITRSMAFVLFVVGLLVWGYLQLIPLVVSRSLGLELAYREILTVALLFPLGFLMGMPFPLGIRFLKQADAAIIPWAWSANGCFSVVGAVLAVVLALRIGFSRVLVIAGAVYLAGGGVVLISFLNLPGHGNKADTPHMSNI